MPQPLEIEGLLRDHVLQTSILVLEDLEPLRVADVEATVLRRPPVEGALGDPEPADNALHLGPSLDLAERPDDLLLAKLALLHRSSTYSEGLALRSVQFFGGRSGHHAPALVALPDLLRDGLRSLSHMAPDPEEVRRGDGEAPAGGQQPPEPLPHQRDHRGEEHGQPARERDLDRPRCTHLPLAVSLDPALQLDAGDRSGRGGERPDLLLRERREQSQLLPGDPLPLRLPERRRLPEPLLQPLPLLDRAGRKLEPLLHVVPEALVPE